MSKEFKVIPEYRLKQMSEEPDTTSLAEVRNMTRELLWVRNCLENFVQMITEPTDQEDGE